MLDENSKNAEDLDEAEIRKIMKKEASKPLLILREEWIRIASKYLHVYLV